MQYTISKPIKYKVLHQQDVYDLWKGFERLVGGTAGRIEVFVRGGDFGEISGDSSEVLESAFMRKQSVRAIHFYFRSDRNDKQFDIYLKQQNSIWDTDSSYSVSSSDEQWFNAKCKEIADLIQILPKTNGIGRVWNSGPGCFLSFCMASLIYLIYLVILFKTRYSGFDSIPDDVKSVCNFIGTSLFVAVFIVQMYVVDKLFPVVDLDIFQKRAAWKQLIKGFVVWIVTLFAPLALGMLSKR